MKYKNVNTYEDDDINTLQLLKWAEKKMASAKKIESCMTVLKVLFL